MNIESIFRLAKFTHNNNRTFIFNLSACFLADSFKDQIIELLPYVDILFGNNDVKKIKNNNNFISNKKNSF